MKEGIHPDYREVVIRDISSDFQMITKSTKKSRESIEIDGVRYPLITVEVSSASHPFYTGKQMLVDSAGRIDRFKSRYTELVGAKRKTRDEKPAEVSKPLSKTKQKKLAKEKSAANAPAPVKTTAEPETES